MNPQILLIEDEDAIRELYKRQLNLAGLSTDAFPTGKEGLDAAGKGHYLIVLLDIMLPDINGLEILKQLKQNAQTKNMSVILLTNLGQDVIIKEGFELGAEGYLVKAAYTPDQIVQEVRNHLQKKQASNGATTPTPEVPAGTPPAPESSVATAPILPATPTSIPETPEGTPEPPIVAPTSELPQTPPIPETPVTTPTPEENKVS